MVEKGEIAQMSNFTFFHNVLYGICVLKSFNSNILVVVCSFFEFGTDSKWCIREQVKYNVSYRLSKLKPTKCLVNPFPNKPWFLCICSTNLLKTLREKEKLLRTSNFSFSPSVFYLFFENFLPFSKFEIVICKLF